jgi:hypothetical protein
MSKSVDPSGADPSYDFMDYGLGPMLEKLDTEHRTEIAEIMRHAFVTFRDESVWDIPAMNTITCSVDFAAKTVDEHAFVFAGTKGWPVNWEEAPPILIQITPADALRAVKYALSWCDAREEDIDDDPLPPPYTIRYRNRKLPDLLGQQLGHWLDAIKEAQDLVSQTVVAEPTGDSDYDE